MLTQEQRKMVLKNASAKQSYFYGNTTVWGEVLQKIAVHQLPESTTGQLITLIGDIILGFYKIEDTVPLLQQELGLDPKTAALLGAEVLEFLAPLSDPNWQPPVDTSEEDEDSTVASTPIEAPVSRIPIKAPANYPEAAPYPTLSTGPAPVSNHGGVAPMSTSVPTPTPSYEPLPTIPAPASEPVYQSNQPAPARPPLSNTPSYTPPATPPAPVATPPAPDRPRWSTDI